MRIQKGLRHQSWSPTVRCEITNNGETEQKQRVWMGRTVVTATQRLGCNKNKIDDCFDYAVVRTQHAN